MTQVVISGRKTGVITKGTGEPALLLHCMLGHSGAWEGVATRLADRLEMTMVDLPGHGQSEFDPEYDIQDQAVETAIILLQQKTRPSHIIGHSFGATVALRIALMRPDLVSSLTLYEPVYFSLLAAEDPQAYEAERQASQTFSDAAMIEDWPAAARAFLARWSMEEFDALPEAIQNNILDTVPLIIATGTSIIGTARGEKILTGLSRLKCPVLLVKGAGSPSVITSIMNVLTDRISHSEQQVIHGASHMGPITHAGAFTKIITAFLSRN